MHELSNIYSDTAMKTVKHFITQLNSDGALSDAAQDVSCYFKLPMMLIYAKQESHADRVLAYIQSRFMTEQGDFMTSPESKSVKPEYIEYWSYMNGWIIRAAQRRRTTNILTKALPYFTQFSAGFLTNSLDSNNGISDVLTAAHHGLIALERDDMSLAHSAGNYLCTALAKQTNKHIFFLRFHQDGSLITDFTDDNALFYCADKNEEDQLYFMLGYPSACLALLYKMTKEKNYLAAAKAYLDFALTCHPNFFTSNFSHKLAWAASIIYNITNDDIYLMPIERIAQHFIEIQSDNGLWYTDADINTSYDQSAEIACWLLDIEMNIRMGEAKKDNAASTLAK